MPRKGGFPQVSGQASGEARVDVGKSSPNGAGQRRVLVYLLVPFAVIVVIGLGAWVAREFHQSAGPTAARPLSHQHVFGGPAAGEIVLDPPGPSAQPKFAESTALAEITHPFWHPALMGGPVLVGLARLNSATPTGLVAPGTPPVGYTNSPSAIKDLTNHLVWIGIYEENPHPAGAQGCPNITGPPTPGALLPVYSHYYYAILIDATTGTREAWTENTSNVHLNDCMKAAR